ncbi:MAG: NAD(P)H-dependent oxidoreductase [Phycisphaerales bacterium]|nr:NAD(P)H-dependent oxidoreductase [Phycisphaerales bacterium]MCB9857291.1 NAD(P)H-dependent oxidoreductase [Phycisphaerales bacterium]MCB9862995.1 NAD(P)H-dependent oxidoreductase [Phycisphaerales bacterium]
MADRRPKILAFAGSMREDSYNKKLVKAAAEGARKAGADVTYIDLREFELPMYDGDIEAAGGLPGGAKRLKTIMKDHDGLLIASPEYNSSISGALKNAIDWASRPATKDEPPLDCFAGKTAALLAASPGALGGLRGLVHLRSILGNIRVIVIPDQKAIPKAHEVFDAEGRIKDDATRESVENIAAELARVTSALIGA